MEEYTYTDEEIDFIVSAATTAGYKAYLRATADMPPIPMSNKFKRWMHKTIKDLQRTPTMRRTVKVGKRIAIAFVAALLAAAMTIMTVSAAREWFISIIRGVWPDSNAKVQIMQNEKTAEFVVYSPTYIPDGYKEMEHMVSDKHKLTRFSYTNLNDPSCTMTIQQFSRSNLKYDHSGEEMGYVDISGNKATYSKKGDRQIISWSDGVGLFLVVIVDPNVDKEEAVKVCESIVPEITLPEQK